LEVHVGQAPLHRRSDRRACASLLANAGLQGRAAIPVPDAARIAAAPSAQSVHAVSLAAKSTVEDDANGIGRLGISVIAYAQDAQAPAGDGTTSRRGALAFSACGRSAAGCGGHP